MYLVLLVPLLLTVEVVELTFFAVQGSCNLTASRSSQEVGSRFNASFLDLKCARQWGVSYSLGYRQILTEEWKDESIYSS